MILSNNGDDFKKSFSKIVNIKNKDEFEKKWPEFTAEYRNILIKKNASKKEEANAVVKKYDEYMGSLYQKKDHWAKCITHLSFNAGNIYTMNCWI